MSQTVIGIFDNASEAQDAVEKLVKSGFDRSSIDISVNNTAAGTSTADTTYGSTSSDTTGSGFGTASTDTAGSTYGNTSSHNEEGESKIGKFFKSLFGSDDDDNSGYSSYAKAAEKGTIVTVHARSVEQAEDAADILDDYGAVNVDDNSTDYNAVGDNTASSLNTDQTSTTGSSVNIIEEQLNVGKKTVETGGVRLRSRIVERPVEESLRLREERVYVNRTPVNRPVTGDELNSFKEGSIELTETAEVPVVAKEAYVKEVVSIGKDVSERDETIRDTVRSTEVDVEDLSKGSIDNTTKSSDFYDTNTKGNL